MIPVIDDELWSESYASLLYSLDSNASTRSVLASMISWRDSDGMSWYFHSRTHIDGATGSGVYLIECELSLCSMSVTWGIKNKY